MNKRKTILEMKAFRKTIVLYTPKDEAQVYRLIFDALIELLERAK